ncbi:MAG: S8 family serine peptidase, partial [Acidimicrobiales bacterium]
MAKKTTKKASKKTSRKQATARKESTAEETPRFPRRIYGIASPRSVGGTSMFEAATMIDESTVGNFASDPSLVHAAVARLEDAGFEVLQATTLMINISGTRRTYERAFGTDLEIQQRETVKSLGVRELAEFIECPDTPIPGLISTVGTDFEDVLEGVAIEEPRYLMAASPYPPSVDYWHLDVPGDVSLGCNADRAHRAGITGKGVTVAMVDSGWFRHPYFVQRGYRADDAILGPGTANPLVDENGHGTGESSNLFAVAPDVQLKPVKAQLAGTLNNVLVNATGAFNDAVAIKPDIITNSWGFDFAFGPLSAASQALAASVAAAASSGIVVVFSAGNGHWGFPGQHPDVISAGGVYMDNDGDLEASSYSSGFMSNIYPGRRVPDVSGLVGMDPAQYIMMPVPEGSQLDVALAGGNHPNGDETANDDGWAAFSGTSAAAPMVAGAAALILQACPWLSPAQVRSILMSTARDVTKGTNAHGNQAVVGPDTATGNGLIDAHKAVLIAKLRCRLLPVIPIVVPPLVPPLIPPVFPIRPPLTPVLPPVAPIRPP